MNYEAFLIRTIFFNQISVELTENVNPTFRPSYIKGLRDLEREKETYPVCCKPRIIAIITPSH